MKDFVIKDKVLTKYNGNDSHVVIPDGVVRIDTWAFYGCRSVTNVKLPNSVVKIDNCAFEHCFNLTSIEISNSVKSIGWGAFYGCKNLTSVNIPSSVTIIGDGAFSAIKRVIPQYNNNKLRAFKAFFHNWICMHDFQYEVGKSYHQDGHIECCENGFHACPNPLNVFNYYWGNLSGFHFAEVELSGEMDWDGTKVAASDIKIIRELSVSELAEIYNNMEKV